jgi:hypothetical protein
MNAERKTFDAIATELCRRVGLAFPPPKGIVYQTDAAQWTPAEENDFREWLTGYLKTVPPYKRMSKSYIKKEVDWFIFQYSWKYKE